MCREDGETPTSPRARDSAPPPRQIRSEKRDKQDELGDTCRRARRHTTTKSKAAQCTIAARAGRQESRGGKRLGGPRPSSDIWALIWSTLFFRRERAESRRLQFASSGLARSWGSSPTEAPNRGGGGHTRKQLVFIEQTRTHAIHTWLHGGKRNIARKTPCPFFEWDS